MRDKFNQFMQGRYGSQGADQLSRFTLIASLVMIALSLFIHNFIGTVLDTLGIVLIVYTYYRLFSRDFSKRCDENRRYLDIISKIRRRFSRDKNIVKQLKDYHIYSCPGCGQKIRIPRGKGRIEISCPKCHTKFVKNS